MSCNSCLQTHNCGDVNRVLVGRLRYPLRAANPNALPSGVVQTYQGMGGPSSLAMKAILIPTGHHLQGGLTPVWRSFDGPVVKRWRPANKLEAQADTNMGNFTLGVNY